MRSTSPTRAPRTRRSVSPAPAACTSASSTTCAPSRPWACARPWPSAAGRDSIASEYVSDFALTFETGIPALVAALGDGLAEREAIVELHLRLLAAAPDTLIARKRGADAAARVSAGARRRARRRRRAHRGRAAGAASFDASLREPGNALNPGTTADLVTATLFVALLEGML